VSDPGPMPRTLVQINLELRDALRKLGEHGPFVLVGHSFGGAVVRNFALTYPKDVAGIVFVDATNEDQRYTLWAQALPGMQKAENSQREWSPESLAKWHSESQAGILGSIPIVVLTRPKGGYGDDLDVPAAQFEQERKDGQATLAKLSSNSKLTIVDSGHNMELEVPDQVAAAIHEILIAVREHKKL